MEAKYLEGEMTATRFLDEASHFFDGWSVHTLDDDWNEAYGAYIQQIEDHRNEAFLDEMNIDLPDIELAADEPRRAPPAPGAAAIPRAFNACGICLQELDEHRWQRVEPCQHSFCTGCVKMMFPPKLPSETDAAHRKKCKPCFVCRGEVKSVGYYFPNTVIMHEGDNVVNVVPAADPNEAAASAAAATATALEEELEDDGAAARRAENQRWVSQIKFTNNHRGGPQPNEQWDQLRDEFDLDDFDLSQPHSQPSEGPAGGQMRPLSMVGVSSRGSSTRGSSARGSRGSSTRGASRGRTKFRARCTRGMNSSRGSRDRASVVQELDIRARSILNVKHLGVGKRSRPSNGGGSSQVTLSAVRGRQGSSGAAAGGSQGSSGAAAGGSQASQASQVSQASQKRVRYADEIDVSEIEDLFADCD